MPILITMSNSYCDITTLISAVNLFRNYFAVVSYYCNILFAVIPLFQIDHHQRDELPLN